MRRRSGHDGVRAGLLLQSLLVAGCCLLVATEALAEISVKPRPRGEALQKAAPNAGQPPAPKLSGSISFVVPPSLEQTGLAQRLVDAFRQQYEVEVKRLVRRSGLGLVALRDGRAEIALSDDPPSEEAFVEAGHALRRHDVMYSEMFVVGPKSDPADIAGMISVIEAFRAIARSRSHFLSRGDGSGVDLAEHRFWREAGVWAAEGLDSWYRVTKAGMRETLERADRTGAYTVTDYATWIAAGPFENLMIVTRDDPRLQLRYGVVVVAAKGNAELNLPAAMIFASWLTDKDAQKLIAEFTIAGERPYLTDPTWAR